MVDSKFLEWSRITDTMRLFAGRGVESVDGAYLVNNECDALKIKKLAIVAILESLCDLIK